MYKAKITLSIENLHAYQQHLQGPESIIRKLMYPYYKFHIHTDLWLRPI